ncbi:putative membrane protein [Deinobacterium chartae]|uniref:Putative membrane protein n=2 Tax=Deinobacterium chartae TaxID=521158 RepID=A0A841I785_9DEIO|nr:putative membrane protein [Deinobacterium chartae]
MLPMLLSTALAQSPDIPEHSSSIGSYLQGTVERLRGETATVTLEGGEIIDAQVLTSNLKVGQEVVIWKVGQRYILEDTVRYPHLTQLFVLFLLVTVLFGRGKGMRAIIGTLLSLLVLFTFIIPQLTHGANILITTLGGIFGILVLTLYFVHGINPKTHAALIGTTLSLLLGLLLTVHYSQAMGISGNLEEANYVSSTFFNFSALGGYITAVLLGTLGALNDVTVTQASVVQSLTLHQPPLAPRDLYRRAMDVGLDHMGSLVNVLVLAYAASALPLMLLWSRDPSPLWQKLNMEGFASEILHILIGSICVLVAVPLTTWVAVWLFHPRKKTP